MAYQRREVKDNETVMNKDLYDNLQDGIDEVKQAVLDVMSYVVEATVEEEP